MHHKKFDNSTHQTSSPSDRHITPPISTATPPYAFHIYLVTPNPEAWKTAFAAASDLLKNMDIIDRNHPHLTYTIYKGTFERFLKTHKAEAIVSLSNSFGLMDGGVDANISDYYGGADKLITHVQRRLEADWSGQQNPGTCTIVDLQDLLVGSGTTRAAGQHYPRYLLHTPIMRLPKHIDPSTDLIYRCVWAILSAVRRHNSPHNLLTPSGAQHPARINSLIMLGMGTGAGELPEETCARQMALACKHFVEAPSNGNPEEDSIEPMKNGYAKSWAYAMKVQEEVLGLGIP
ncbi:hypothetical protein BC938DRAFT_476387 [Jimgerdemannia flammicorona]|uniref:Macro domain-containing protein n=1 Tax=Jimgerdemannia flammicorona TaxID=994334 RepID=A0A433QQM0_9FUNG|nr:hypothetical protein BC938DRAFT_476387 [Jimgerdemannia flammicorona]